MAKFGEKYLSTISPNYVDFLVKILFYFFFTIFVPLVFVDMGPYAVKISNDISSEITCQIHFKTTPRKCVYQNCAKHCEISDFQFFAFFVVFINMRPYGRKSFKQLHLL